MGNNFGAIMEVKYPVCYAIESIYNPISYECIGEVVSKCFVLEENIKYFPSGAMIADYKVVFPYQEIDAFGNIKQEVVTPIDNNITRVNKIYQIYADAKKRCILNNSCRSELQRLKLDVLEEQIAKATAMLVVNFENKGIEKVKSL